MKRLLLALLFIPATLWASGVALPLDRAPDVQRDKAALQRGARLYVSHCLGCHGLSFVRYSQLQDLDLSESQIRDDLMFTADRIGEPMRIAARPAEQKQWFGVAPPDLSLVVRARASEAGSGADWSYTFLRSFYRDERQPSGWNNTLFPQVAMPHALWELQGQKVLDPQSKQLQLAVPGLLSPSGYDQEVADLVGFLVWAGEPGAEFRRFLGGGVLVFLLIFFALALALKKEYWKDVK